MKEDDDREAAERLALVRSVLESDALYASVDIAGEAYYVNGAMQFGAPLPGEVSLYCATVGTCERVVPWDSNLGKNDLRVFPGSPRSLRFTCRVFRKVGVWLIVYATGSERMLVFLAGRVPQPKIIAAIETTRTFTKEDARYFDNALRCRAEGMGIAAVTYLRRVVENEMDRLLDLLIMLLEQSGDPSHTEALQLAKKLTNQNRFSEKARAAAAVLPSTFFPGEQNPFERLHDLASDGVHNLNDVESCDRFDELRGTFQLLFERLTRDVESRKLFADGVKRLGSRKKN